MITVRRGRIARLPSMAEPDGARVAPAPAAKDPRVFRLGAVPPATGGPDPAVKPPDAAPRAGGAEAVQVEPSIFVVPR